MSLEEVRKFQCLKCENRWEVPFGSGRQMVCPQCGSMKIRRLNPCITQPGGCRRRRRGRGQRGEGV